MTSGEQGPSFGTVFHPEPDLVINGGGRMPPGQLRSLPRRRRPGMVALAIALIGAGVLGSAALYARENHAYPVLVVTATVPPGTLITSADIGTASIEAGPGIQTIPARQLQQVIGLVAATALHPGTVLTAADLTSGLPPQRGRVLVPVEVKQATLPVFGLAAGDRVLVVATPVVPGTTSSVAQVLIQPVAAVVLDVRPTPNQDGWAVVDLLVPAASGVALAQQSSTGQIAFVVTSRASS